METEQDENYENYEEIAAANRSIRGKSDIAWSYVIQSKIQEGKRFWNVHFVTKKN